MLIRKKINQISSETEVPTKKVLDFLFRLRMGEAIDNNILLRKTGVSKNALNQVKKLLFSFLEPPSKNTQLKSSVLKEIKTLFEENYRTEEDLLSLKNEDFQQTVQVLEKYKDQHPIPDRKYDQFTATTETTARRASLLNFFEDIRDKRLFFLGDDDFTSVAVANFRTAFEIEVVDLDNRILNEINVIAKKEQLEIKTNNYDARRSLPNLYSGKFDVVFTDPPYTREGIKLFLSRAVQALDVSNRGCRIYMCYGNSDRAKERFIPIYDLIRSSGLMIRWIFDKFNRYQGAESIGSSSSLFILEVTPKTKPLILGNYDKPIYTYN